MPCCPGRPAHLRSRTFFRAAAALALIAGGLSGTLGTQAVAADYTNPQGTTVGLLFYTNGSAPTNITNAGVARGLEMTFGTSATSFLNTSTGSITNSGTYDNGVVLYGNSSITTLTNNGVIQGRYGVDLELGSSIQTLNNTGAIDSRDWAILLNNNSTITTLNNTGSITGTTDGINNQGSGNVITTLNNSGTISAGTRFAIINGGVITTFNNSGIISGPAAIVNDGTIGTLNLLTGSVITGGISNSGTIGTLNVYHTVTNANFDSAFSVPTVSGNQPGTTNIFVTTPANSKFVTVGGRTVGIDTSGFGANGQAIRHVSNSVGRLVNTNGVIQSIGAKVAKHNADPYAMTSDLCADGAPAQPGQIGNSDFWIRGFTGRNKVDATASSTDYINTYSGGAIGIDRDWSEDIRGGVFIGSGNMNNSLGGGLGGTESDLIFAGTYATKTWGTLFAKVGLTGGRGSNTGTRNIAAGAPETATADYKNWYVSPEVSVGKVYDLGQHLGGSLSVTPVLSVRYVYASQDGYTETGATNNLTMNKSHSTTIEERAELKFSYATKAFNDYGVKVNASVGGIGQQNNGGAMSGTLLGAPLSFATPGDDNSTGFVGGLGFEVNRGKYTFTASGDYVRLSGGNADLSANVVFSVKF
jgi:outer membrane autotransporter protein